MIDVFCCGLKNFYVKILQNLVLSNGGSVIAQRDLHDSTFFPTLLLAAHRCKVPLKPPPNALLRLIFSEQVRVVMGLLIFSVQLPLCSPTSSVQPWRHHPRGKDDINFTWVPYNHVFVTRSIALSMMISQRTTSTSNLWCATLTVIINGTTLFGGGTFPVMLIHLVVQYYARADSTHCDNWEHG